MKSRKALIGALFNIILSPSTASGLLEFAGYLVYDIFVIIMILAST